MAATAKLESEATLNLFSPIQVRPYEINNHIVMASLTRSRAGEGNVRHELNALYYAQRASAGLIIVEAPRSLKPGKAACDGPRGEQQDRRE